MLLFLGKLTKFGNAYQEAIGRRKKKKCTAGRKHENIGNKRKKLNNIGNIGALRGLYPSTVTIINLPLQYSLSLKKVLSYEK